MLQPTHDQRRPTPPPPSEREASKRPAPPAPHLCKRTKLADPRSESPRRTVVTADGTPVTIGSLICRGGSASVFEGSLKEGGSDEVQCALRVCLTPSARNLAEMKRTVAVLEKCRRHPFIVELLGRYVIDDCPVVALKRADCDLFHCLYEAGAAPCADPPLARKVGDNIISAVAHLHSLNWSHCDIKPENILVCRRAGGVIYQLCDMGFVLPLGSRLEKLHGTPEYFPLWGLSAGATPMVITPRLDCYTLALVCAEVSTGVQLKKAQLQPDLLKDSKASPNGGWIAALEAGDLARAKACLQQRFSI